MAWRRAPMPGPDLIVLRSKDNPGLYVITERSRYRMAVDGYHATDPDDSLIHVPPDRAAMVLRGLVDTSVVEAAINSQGLYRLLTN